LKQQNSAALNDVVTYENIETKDDV